MIVFFTSIIVNLILSKKDLIERILSKITNNIHFDKIIHCPAMLKAYNKISLEINKSMLQTYLKIHFKKFLLMGNLSNKEFAYSFVRIKNFAKNVQLMAADKIIENLEWAKCSELLASNLIVI